MKDRAVDSKEPGRQRILLPDGNGILRGKWLLNQDEAKLGAGIAMPISTFGLDIWGREVLATGLHVDSGDRDGLCFPVRQAAKEENAPQDKEALVLVAMQSDDGEPLPVDPRGQSIRLLERVKKHGLFPVVAFELEFYLLKPEQEKGHSDFGLPDQFTSEQPGFTQLYALKALEDETDFFDRLMAQAALYDLPISAVSSEAAPGQFEVNLYHRNNAIEAADDAILLRHLITQTAAQLGLQASFMAKPRIDWAGSGMHVHMSLVNEGGDNQFAGEAGLARLQRVTASLLKFMPETLLLFAATFNGMRRFVPEAYTSTWASWGRDNRSVALRLPNADAKNQRFEHRVAGADANPYLVLAAILAGVLDGLEKVHDLPPETKVNAEVEGPASEALRFPPDFGRALAAFETSGLARDYFGDEFTRIHAAIKRQEQEAFQRYLSPLEIQSYI